MHYLSICNGPEHGTGSDGSAKSGALLYRPHVSKPGLERTVAGQWNKKFVVTVLWSLVITWQVKVTSYPLEYVLRNIRDHGFLTSDNPDYLVFSRSSCCNDIQIYPDFEWLKEQGLLISVPHWERPRQLRKETLTQYEHEKTRISIAWYSVA